MLEIKREGLSQAAALQRAYDHIYAGRGIHQLDSFYIWLVGLLRAERGRRLLDVSCGEGGMLWAAQRAGLEVYGVELSPVAAAAARRRCPQAHIAVGDGESLPYPDRAFDCVTHIGSLEHYLDPERGMREMARVLKPTGTAGVLLPNAFGLLWNVYWVLRTGDLHDDGQPLQRYATPHAWRALLENNGLRVHRIVKYERAFPRTVGDAFWYLRRPHKLLYAALSALVPTNWGSCLVYICSPQGRGGR